VPTLTACGMTQRFNPIQVAVMQQHANHLRDLFANPIQELDILVANISRLRVEISSLESNLNDLQKRRRKWFKEFEYGLHMSIYRDGGQSDISSLLTE
jgi:hypothetical protein